MRVHALPSEWPSSTTFKRRIGSAQAKSSPDAAAPFAAEPPWGSTPATLMLPICSRYARTWEHCSPPSCSSARSSSSDAATARSRRSLRRSERSPLSRERYIQRDRAAALSALRDQKRPHALDRGRHRSWRLRPALSSIWGVVMRPPSLGVRTSGRAASRADRTWRRPRVSHRAGRRIPRARRGRRALSSRGGGRPCLVPAVAPRRGA